MRHTADEQDVIVVRLYTWQDVDQTSHWEDRFKKQRQKNPIKSIDKKIIIRKPRKGQQTRNDLIK